VGAPISVRCSDQLLTSFDAYGGILVSPALSDSSRHILGLDPALRLRWVAGAHLPYLAFHRHSFDSTYG